jgi:hypothetical protein
MSREVQLFPLLLVATACGHVSYVKQIIGATAIGNKRFEVQACVLACMVTTVNCKLCYTIP